jgi:hypothetical protein
MPVMATIASALAGYVARKGQYLEETLMPRLRGSTDVGALARDLADRAKARVPGIAGGAPPPRTRCGRRFLQTASAPSPYF